MGFLPDDVFNEGTHNKTLGDAKAGLSPELDALSAYVTSLDRVHESPHRDPDGSLTEQGWRGLEVFQRAGCSECHGGSDFTDSATGVLHDVGTILETSGHRLGGDLEGFDTPTLRGIWETAPYLHDGSAETVLDVISTKNPDDEHGATSDLSDDERADLVSYLLQIDNVALEDEVEPESAADSPGSGGQDDDGGCSIQSRRGSRDGRSGEWVGVGLLALFGFAARRRLKSSVALDRSA
jgi:mono/diheme cytochrome c family protein